MPNIERKYILTLTEKDKELIADALYNVTEVAEQSGLNEQVEKEVQLLQELHQELLDA